MQTTRAKGSKKATRTKESKKTTFGLDSSPIFCKTLAGPGIGYWIMYDTTPITALKLTCSMSADAPLEYELFSLEKGVFIPREESLPQDLVYKAAKDAIECEERYEKLHPVHPAMIISDDPELIREVVQKRHARVSRVVLRDPNYEHEFAARLAFEKKSLGMT